MKSELTPRQWALYNYLKDRGDTWTTQLTAAIDISLTTELGFYDEWDKPFHDSTARLQMTKDIRAINDSSVIQKIIISSPRGIKLATEAEFDEYIRKEISSAVRRLNRAKHKAEKGNRDGQMRFVLNSERDTVKAFIDSDKYFGIRLKNAREASGWTMKKAADNLKACGLNIDEPMLSKFENGYCLPNKTTLSKLAEIYGVTGEYLLTGFLSTKEPTGEIDDLQVAERVYKQYAKMLCNK